MPGALCVLTLLILTHTLWSGHDFGGVGYFHLAWLAGWEGGERETPGGLCAPPGMGSQVTGGQEGGPPALLPAPQGALRLITVVPVLANPPRHGHAFEVP